MYEWNLLTKRLDNLFQEKKAPYLINHWLDYIGAAFYFTTAICVNNYLFNLEVKEEKFSSNTDYSSFWIMCLFSFYLQDYVKTNI